MSAQKVGDADYKEFRRKLDGAQNGDIDAFAFDVARCIIINRRRQKELGDKSPPLIPLHKLQEEWILKAVYDFDRAALKALLKAMDICEYGTGMHNSNAALVIYSYHSFESPDNRSPTIAELRKQMRSNNPAIQIDDRTLRFICKREDLALSPIKRGRPLANSVVKKKRLPL